MLRTWLVNLNGRLGWGVKAACKKRSVTTFRPCLEGLEDRWCPTEFFQWKAMSAGVWSNIGNWNESHDDITWFPAVVPPGTQSSDVVQFDGTGTGT
jgi:hypothetical protein